MAIDIKNKTKLCIICNEVKTNNPKQICVGCEMKMSEEDKQIETEEVIQNNDGSGGNGERPKNLTTTERYCEMCKEPFMPTGNTQTYCPDCSVERARERGRNYWKKKKEMRGNGGSSTGIMSDITIIKKNTSHLLTLDFKHYEPLLEFLKSEAVKDFRTPELQLIFWLNEMVNHESHHLSPAPAACSV